jgi:dephospho-CoA kinase
LARQSATPLKWPPLVVAGLTGGIASGKSTVAAMFAACGAQVINADDEGRAAVQPGEPALPELVAAFGAGVLLADGTLNRREVADRVFGHPAELRTLNRITHPRIREQIAKKLLNTATNPPIPPVVVVEAAILIEAGWAPLADRIIVVVAQHSTQATRLMAKHGLNARQAEARILAQLPTSGRLRHADYKVDGEGPLPVTQQQVAEIWNDLVQLSRRPPKRGEKQVT